MEQRRGERKAGSGPASQGQDLPDIVFLRRKSLLEIGVQCSRRGSSEVMPDRRVRTSGSRRSEPGRDRAHLPGAVKGWWEVEGGGSAGAEGTRAEPQPSFGSVPREGSLCRRHRRLCGKQSGAFQGFAQAGGGGRARSPEQVFLPQQVPAFTAQPCPFPRLG